MKSSTLIILVVTLFSIPQAFADWDLDSVDFEILTANFDSQAPHILKIQYVVTNLENPSMIMRGKELIDLRVIDYSVQEVRVSKPSWIESYEYVSPAKLEMDYGNANVTQECEKIDFTIKQGESVTSTICFEVSPTIIQYLNPESTREYHLVLSTRNINSCPFCESIRILIASEPAQIPDWVKNSAKWWSLTEISDQDFAKSLEYLIQQNIIQIPKGTSSDGDSEQQLPSWLRKNAGWWSQGLLSDDEFVKSIQWMINNGFIKI